MGPPHPDWPDLQSAIATLACGDAAQQQRSASMVLAGRRSGNGELRLDPLANEAVTHACAIACTDGVLSHTWNHEGKTRPGGLRLPDANARRPDTFHQPEGVDLRASAPRSSGRL